MADKRISQLIERVDIANNDVLPIVASGATTTNKVTISTIQDWMQSNLDVGVTSVGLTMPSAFQVSGSPITTSGNINVTATGTASQYIRGDGTLADFPQGGGGGGASVSYYLNGSVSQGTIGGIAYLEMNKTPILGAGTDFTISSDGYIASFITDAGDPALLQIPAGNWNFETYLQASSGGGTPTFYIELYKVDSGGTATLIASNSGTPELIAFGTTINPYFSALAVPQTTLLVTDRLALRYYVSPSGRTITLHTENNTLCQIITTFTTGLTALNGLTAQVQNFATGTSGTNFGITSSGSIHTFNLPDASASARGVVTTGSQVFGGVKTFADGLSLPSVGGTNQASRFVNIGTIHQGSGGSNQIGFNNSNNIYFGKGLDNGGVIQWSNSAVRYYTLPNADGTIALTSDLGNYVPYTGATSNVDLGSNSLSSRNLTANGGLNTGALLLKNANQASLINTGYFTLTPSSTTTSISFGYSTGANTWKSAIFSSHLLTDNTPTVFSLPNGGGTLALTSDLGGYLPLTGGTLTGALNGTVANFTGNGTFGGDLQSSTRVAASTGGQAIILTANSGGTTNRIETTGVLPMALVSGGNITLAAGGTTPQITLASTGAVTLTGALNGTSANFSDTLIASRSSAGASVIVTNTGVNAQLQFANNTSQSTIGIANLGSGAAANTFYINTSLGAIGSGITMNDSGAVTLAGALSGTSASFTGSVTSTGFRSNTENGYVLRNNANSLNLGGLTRRSFWAGGTSLDTQIFAETGYGIFLNPGGSSSIGLTLASTGAATFSSSVTSQVNNISADGVGVVLQGYIDNTLRIAARGSGYNDGARGGLFASSGDFSTTLNVAGAATFSSSVMVGGGVGHKIELKDGAAWPTIRRNTSTGGIIFDTEGSSIAGSIFSVKTLNGSDFVTVTSGGNVGIGTSSPDTFGARLVSFASSGKQFTATNGVNADFDILCSSGVTTFGADTGVTAIKSAGSERMRITSTGNVGIGTPTPSGQLHLKGASGVPNFGTQILQVESSTDNFSGIVFSGTNGSNAAIRSEGASTMSFWTASGTSYTKQMTITSGGNLGIGTATPSERLEVSASGNVYAKITSTSNGANAGIRLNSTNAREFGIFSDGDLRFYDFTAATDRMRITSGGDVFVGSGLTAPNSRRQLLIGGSSVGTRISLGLNGNPLYGHLTVDSGGNLILANDFNDSAIKVLIVNFNNGVYLSQSATSWTSNSDERLKNINGEIENAVDKLCQLRAVNFSWKNDENQKENLGLIAQDVEKVFPEVIDKNTLANNEDNEDADKTEYLGVRYQELIPVLIKAIQEQQEQIKSLTEQVEALKSQING